MRRSTLQAMAQVRKYSHRSAHVGFPSPCTYVQAKLVFLCTNPRLAGRVIRVEGRGILLFTAYFEHSVGFRSDINASLMQDVCFLTRDGKLPFILGADFNFPPSLWQDLSIHGGSLWLQKLGASVVIPGGTTHTCRVGKGQKPDIIDYFLVSTLIRPLIQKCESQADAQHQLRIGGVQTADWEVQQAESVQHERTPRTEHTERANPAIWNEARRNCVFEGKKPRCQDGQEDTQAACCPYAHACGFLEEADELGHALETWSDATTQYWEKVGRMNQTLFF